MLVLAGYLKSQIIWYNEYMKNIAEQQFEEIVRPVMKYLAESHHPHKKIIITNIDAEIVEGKMSFFSDEYIHD
jgi:hypothetical protein